MIRNPVDYRLCRQTVTVYHRERDKVTRKVLENVFFQRKRKRVVDKNGIQDHWGFLLIVPGEEHNIFPGDKIVNGVGGEAKWSDLVTQCVVKWVEQEYWDGRPVHTEAGA